MPKLVAFGFATLGEAHAARSALEAAGVEVRLADENVVAIEWLYSNAVGGVKLLVPEEHREQAEGVLTHIAREAGDDAVPDGSSEEAGAVGGAEGRCPACGSADLFEIPKLSAFGALSIVLFGAGVAVHRPELVLAGVAIVGLVLAFVDGTRCRACGASWQSDPSEARAAEAPPPSDADTIGLVCPRCGKAELHYVRYRRLKAVPLLVPLTVAVVLPIWLLLPKKRCDHCGLRLWI